MKKVTNEERKEMISRLLDPLWVKAFTVDSRGRKGAFTQSNDSDHDHEVTMEKYTNGDET